MEHPFLNIKEWKPKNIVRLEDCKWIDIRLMGRIRSKGRHALHHKIWTFLLRERRVFGRALKIGLKQGCQTHRHRGPHESRGCLQRAKCNFSSLTVKE